MADFPTVLSALTDDAFPVLGDEILAKHINHLETKIGIDGSAVATSLDYLLKNVLSIDPGHKHTILGDGVTDAYIETPAHPPFGGSLGIGRPAVGGGVFGGVEIFDPGFAAIHLIGESSVATGYYGIMLFCYTLYNPAAPTPNVRIFEFGGEGELDDDGTIAFCDWYVALSDPYTYMIFINQDANIGFFNATTFGTNANKVMGMGQGTAPTSAPANLVQMWTEDINGAAGKTGLHMMAESGTNKLVVAGVIIKTNTGDPTQVHEGLMCINTFDNTVKIYADAAWRTIVSW